MTFAEAKAFVMHFGKYEGKSLDEIATSDQGLRYLDWARGALRLDFHTKNAVEAYLNDPTIAKDVANLARAKA
jgi:hypothetical protein